MALKIYFFGSLVDVTGKSVTDFQLLPDTDSVNVKLQEMYPALKLTKYFIAVNQQMIQSNQPLVQGDVVAFMPPFSGG